MIKKYFLNFWIWWYGAQLLTVIQKALSLWNFTLMRLNVLPMITNLFVPMFQDTSFSGKILSFFLRIVWILWGTIIQILVTIPLVGYVLVWVSVPVFCIIQIVRVFI